MFVGCLRFWINHMFDLHGKRISCHILFFWRCRTHNAPRIKFMLWFWKEQQQQQQHQNSFLIWFSCNLCRRVVWLRCMCGVDKYVRISVYYTQTSSSSSRDCVIPKFHFIMHAPSICSMHEQATGNGICCRKKRNEQKKYHKRQWSNRISSHFSSFCACVCVSAFISQADDFRYWLGVLILYTGFLLLFSWMNRQILCSRCVWVFGARKWLAMYAHCAYTCFVENRSRALYVV